MAGAHDHGGGGHGHGIGAHAGARHRWRLAVALGVIGTFFVVELVAGLVADSLALLSDAGHMAADVLALGAALAATRIATRPDSTGRRTFGSYRAEVFAAGLTVLLMVSVAVFILNEARLRIGEDVEVASGPMLAVGALGLVANLVALFLLRGGAGESINVKGAYLEVLADTLGSVGVIAAGLLVMWTGNPVWDTVVALAIAAFVVVRAVLLGREVVQVLGQHAPAGIVPAEVEAALAEVPGVSEVHDLHVWCLTSGMNVATAHLVAAPGETDAVLSAAAQVLRERFQMEHATLQVESTSHECHTTDW
ncbi:cation diffusion facilitator family transporter [Nocardioides jishulii]|uniref:Cation transporter n=1 Tax=Nocardioides jishulii TaxID=2575440 RepID=A0A4U2YRC9_9ACTN|nr:cation diffusion facilitator family transporter [Nocardioides jishulii]QCX26268.1 cation transporter [Nocardioides jishulii]TKI63928.1 cation transporter [Nocardioides jishulii]